MDERWARFAANEATFRAGNELIERAVGGHAKMPAPGEEVLFLCECGDERCFERVTMTVREYEEGEIIERSSRQAS